ITWDWIARGVAKPAARMPRSSASWSPNRSKPDGVEGIREVTDNVVVLGARVQWMHGRHSGSDPLNSGVGRIRRRDLDPELLRSEERSCWFTAFGPNARLAQLCSSPDESAPGEAGQNASRRGVARSKRDAN